MKTPFKSLYPSIIGEHNIAPNTQIGKIIIQEMVHENENPYNNPKYSRGGDFVDNLVTNNILEFAHRWLHLANFMEFLEDVQEYYEKSRISYSIDTKNYNTYYYKNGELYTAPVKDIGPAKVISPVNFDNKIKPVTFYNERVR